MKKLLSILCVFAFFFALATEAKSQNRKAVSGAEVTGTFRDVSGSEFRILARGKGKLRVAFSGIYPYKMANGEAMAHTGEAFGTAFIEGDTATFTPGDAEKCTITLKFLRGGKMKVTQKVMMPIAVSGIMYRRMERIKSERREAEIFRAIDQF